MKELASERRRFGYRRLHILLKREGWNVNWKKLYRLYREEGLTVRKRGGRKRAVGTRTPMAIPQGPNQRWSLDFMSDALEDGRRFRVLNVIDDFSRECLAAVVDTSIGGARVARELDRIAELRGYPCMVVSDNGTELTSNAMLKWQEDRKVGWHYIAPGKPMQNGLVESFNGDARGVPERTPVPVSAPCLPHDCGMARRLQSPPPTFEPRRAHPVGVSPTVKRGPNPAGHTEHKAQPPGAVRASTDLIFLRWCRVVLGGRDPVPTLVMRPWGAWGPSALVNAPERLIGAVLANRPRR